MLLRFSVSNFTSIRDFQELSLIAGPLSGNEDALIVPDGISHKLLRVAAIYGPNASGKSNVMWALRFMRNAVRNSQKNWDPGTKIARHPFALDDSSGRPTEFSIDILVAGVRYEYGFSVDDLKVTSEYLFAYPENRRQLWFERTTEKPQISFGKSLTGENRAIENLTRPDSLFLSAAAQNNHEKLLPIFRWFSSNIRFRSGLQERSGHSGTVEMCLKDEETKKAVVRLLAGADLGIVGMEIREPKPDEKMNTFAKKFHQLLSEFAPSTEEVTDFNFPPTASLLHKTSGEAAVSIPMEEESAGTLAFLGMLGPAIEALEAGGVLCVDELDASLHPLLVADIVRIFNTRERNARGAQLIFTTHNTELLGTDLLRRDQIWFTEKDDSGATRLYPLSDFKPRKQENLQRGYLQGRYGATPFIRASALIGTEP